MECFPLFTSPFPGDGYDASILYARVVFALSATKKKVIFVVIRTFLLIDLSVCARRVFLF